MTGPGSRFDFAAMQAEGNQAGIPELYVLIMTPLPLASGTGTRTSSGEVAPLEAHYAYMHRILQEGKVLLIGPCLGEPAIPNQSPVPPGIGILRVASRDEAEEIARKEPFHAMGWRQNTVMPWTPKFGSLVELVGEFTGTTR